MLADCNLPFFPKCEKKNMQPKILYPVRLSFGVNRENKNYLNKQLEDLVTTKLAL